MAERRGIRIADQLQLAMNVLPTTAARWWRVEMVEIALKTIDALCEVPGCKHGELVIRVSNEKAVNEIEQQTGGN